MRPLSLDLRKRIIEALQSGQTRTQAAERFRVSLSSVRRLKKQWAEQENLEPKPILGRTRAVKEKEPEAQQLQELIAARNDWTLRSLAQAFEHKVGKGISTSALHRNLCWLGYSYKKRVVSLSSATHRSAPRSKQP